jgi:hypothetical protein
MKLKNHQINNLTLPEKDKFISDEHLLKLTDLVVNRYVASGTIPVKEKEDVKMSIIEKFLQKKQVIQDSFSGKAKVSTYCMAILNRMCCEVIRKEIKFWKEYSIDQLDKEIVDYKNTSAHLLIQDEIKLLQRILQLFENGPNKIRLFLAYFYQLPILKKDVSAYDINYFEHKLWDIFSDSTLKNKSGIFENLAIAVQKAEQKQIKADAVRMWLNKSIQYMLNRLNGPFNRANYTAESLQILFEYYYTQRIQDKQKLKKRT